MDANRFSGIQSASSVGVVDEMKLEQHLAKKAAASSKVNMMQRTRDEA